MVSLVVTAGPIEGQRFDFVDHDTLLFGRAPGCHARLPETDISASRHHFLLEVNPPLARLRDLGSLNGTHVNGVRHGGRETRADGEPGAQVDLRHGDVIRVGATTFRVEVQAPATCVSCRRPLEPESGLAGLCDSCARTTPASVVDPDSAAAPGTRIGPYVLERLLGKGGMGAVYLARRPGVGASVALKVMLPAMLLDEAGQWGFLREIEITRSLRHRNIVSLLDFGRDVDRFYFALEYCARGSSETLRLSHGGRLPLACVRRIAEDALLGLAAAHEAGFVHRDLKPDNVLLAEDGTARLADFGLARSFQKSRLSGMTATSVAGTYYFMPREQLTSFRCVRPVSDVWSMAATLYRLLTGQYTRDFQTQPDPLAVILAGDVVPLRARDPSLPPAFAEVVDRALDDRPEARYPSAGAFLAALQAAC